tara:strand:+ start:1094 stop:1834 length:741 start_codon:yes stop_codon:yes gene_type:complete
VESSNIDYVIVTATVPEQEVLLEATGGLEPTVLGRRKVVFGQIFGRRVAIAETGIGAVNTAQALTAFLETQRVSQVLQVGIGGAFPTSGLVVGDLAIASEEIQGDFGVVSETGWSGGETIGIPLIQEDPPLFNRIRLDPALTESAATAGNTVADRERRQSKVGAFLTVQNVTGTDQRAAEFNARFGALCENMEGAAAAHVCRLYQIPFCEVRGISNIVEKRDLSRWDIPAATRIAQSAALELIQQS